MAELKGMDVAWARPTIAQILATGAHWVARYFSPDASKNLTVAEVKSYPAAGLGIVTVFESTTGRARQGRAAGVADAQLAERQRAAVGLPATHIHHFAVDEDTDWASVQAYFDGAASVIGLARVGCYGGFPVIEGAAAHGIHFLWQTVAWSGGRWSAHATIRQPGGTLLAGAADVDYAEAPDFGQYPRPVAPPAPNPHPNPAPIPVPTPPSHLKDIDMFLVTVDKQTIPLTTPPTPWPGTFLLCSDGSLAHVTPAVTRPDKTVVDNVLSYGRAVGAPVPITYAEYLARMAKTAAK